MNAKAAPLLEEPVPRALLRLALPVLASHVLRLGYQWVDAFWVRGLGVDATAAVTTSVFVMWFVYSLSDVFGVGVSSYVSQLIGAGDRERAGVAARKGLTAQLAMGLVAMALGLFASRAIFSVMDPTGRVVDSGTAYLSVVLTGAPFIMVSLGCESVMRAAGDTRTPFLVDLGAIALNIVLAPILIYGLWGAPRLGVAGAAWATVISQALMLASYIALAVRRHPAFPFAWRAPGAPVRVVGLAKVGVPAAFIGVLFSVVYVAFVRAASPYGPAAVAIVGLANRIEAVQFILSVAVGLGGATLLGQALGAGRVDRAQEVLRTGQRWIAWIALGTTILYFAAPRALLSIFSQDAALLEMGVPYMRVLSLAMMATGIEIVTAEMVLASGHTQVISIIFTAFSLARIPLAFLVPRWTGLGVTGIAWLITITCWLRASLVIGWVARGTWKRGLARELQGTSPPSGPATGEASGA